jgi:MFS transporter, PHS family, inorganic phosphate transporter
LAVNQDLGVKVATPVGTLVGQLLFGWLADMVGRKRMCMLYFCFDQFSPYFNAIAFPIPPTDGIELMIIIIATFGQTITADGQAVRIIGALVVWRFLVSLIRLPFIIVLYSPSSPLKMGVGIGGDYPLSAVISSEFASTKIRGRMMTVVFANQGWGQLSAAIIATIITVAYKNSIIGAGTANEHTYFKIDQMWRLLIGFGCIPGVIALYFRLTIPETPRFTMDIERNVQQASADIEAILTQAKNSQDLEVVAQRADAPKASWADFSDHFSQWQNLKTLIGTSYSWFALDVSGFPFY